MSERRLPFTLKGKEGTIPFTLCGTYKSKSSANRAMRNYANEFSKKEYKPKLRVAKRRKGFGLYQNY